MVALLTSERLNVLALLDDEKKSRGTRDELVKAKLIRDDSVVFVTEAFASPAPAEADIEDLLEPDVFDMLVQHTYERELAGRKLALRLVFPALPSATRVRLQGLGWNSTRRVLPGCFWRLWHPSRERS